MYQLKNKIIAFVFSLLVAAPVFLSVKFILEEILILQEAHERMETGALISVNVPATELTWIKKGREVLINGRLFDVKSFRVLENLVIFTGFFDDKETSLLEEYKNITEGNRDNPLNDLTVKFLFSPVYDSHTVINCSPAWKVISSQYYSFEAALPVVPGLLLTKPPQS